MFGSASNFVVGARGSIPMEILYDHNKPGALYSDRAIHVPGNNSYTNVDDYFHSQRTKGASHGTATAGQKSPHPFWLRQSPEKPSQKLSQPRNAPKFPQAKQDQIHNGIDDLKIEHGSGDESMDGDADKIESPDGDAVKGKTTDGDRDEDESMDEEEVASWNRQGRSRHETHGKFQEPARQGLNRDNLKSIVTKTCWIAAEHALQHARSKKSLISESFNRWYIPESDYIVLAGFDESLIESGIGYLEQIHVFVSGELGAASPLFSELGRIFSPFSSMLFTESQSYYLPVFKDDGSIWEFDAFVYDSTSKFADGGSSAKMTLTVVNFSASGGQAGNPTGFSQGSSSSGGGDNNERGYTDKGKERQFQDQDEADESDMGNKDPGDDPEEPTGDNGGTDAVPKGIFFAVVSQLYPMSSQNPFQSLKVQGDMTIQTTHARNPRRVSKRQLYFTELKFGTQPRAGTEMVYKQFHVRVIVDSQRETARVKVIKPRRTPAFDGDEKESSSTKTAKTHSLIVGFTAGASPQGTASLSSANTHENAMNNEKKRYTSGITQQDEYGVIHWGFAVDDVNDQKGGIDMRDNVLPTVEFEFVGPSSSTPPAPPARMNIEIASYWSIIASSRKAPKSNRSPWFLSYTGSSGDVLVEDYTNLCQIIALETIPSDLPERSNYEATVHVSPTPGVGYLSDYTEVLLGTDNSVRASPGVFPDDSRTLTTLTLPMHKKLDLSATFGQTLQRLGGDSKSH